MPRADVVVLGGGPSGLCAALALARGGRRILLVERDPLGRGTSPEEAFTAERRGIAHYLAPHAFLPRGRKVMQERAPDVYAALLERSAFELPIARDQPDVRAADAELMVLCVRRPLIEWALRDAVLRERRIEVVAARAEGLLVEDGRVVGVATSGGELRAPLVVDAMGRTSRAPRWLADAAIAVAEESHEVGIVYYSRYYRLLPGLDFPASAHPLGPRGDLGYALYASFLGDDRTFAIALMVPAGDSDLKALKDPHRHHAACAALPEVADWVAPDVSAPISGVSAMGALRTTWRAWNETAPPGFVAVADAFCHTDPSFALGLSLALVHGFALADALADGGPDGFWDAVTPELRERFELARDVSGVRLARLRGEEPPDLEAPRTFAALNALAQLDADVFRLAFRRIGFLDRLGPLDDTIRDRLSSLPPLRPPAPALARDDLLAAISSA